MAVKDKFLRLNIALKLPPEIANRAIGLSHKIGKNYEVFFVLDGINFYPHITIYSPEFPISNINQIFKEVKDILKSTKRIKLSFKSSEISQDYIGINFRKSSEIKKLHENIIKKLNPLRENHLRNKYKNSDYLQQLTKNQYLQVWLPRFNEFIQSSFDNQPLKR